MVYGYARVSTRGQEKNGNSLEGQENLLKENGAEIIFVDSFTGTRMARPEFNKLMDVIESGDTLIVTKLDRFARSVAQASELITNLIDKGIRVNVLNLGILDNSSVSTLMRNILLSFAQFERDMIIERTQEGKAIARMSPGFQEGRPKKFKKEQRDHAFQLLETGEYTYRQIENLTGISVSTLHRIRRAAQTKDS